MNRTFSTLASFLLVLQLASSLMTGCSQDTDHIPSGPSAQESTLANNDPFSKAVKLSGYLIGTPPDGSPEVFNALNRKLTADINATMGINYIGWSEMDVKYPLVLAAGENIDWIFTADWCKYMTESAKGAFLELTPDLLSTYMPRHMAALDPQGWEQAEIGGRIFTIPTSTPDRKGYGISIRGDLRKKYSLPEIMRISDLEPYLNAIKTNHPEMLPMNLDNSFDVNAMIFYLMNENGGNIQDLFAVTGSGGGVYREFDGPDPWKVFTMFDAPYYGKLVENAKIMKRWYDDGYINQNVFANKVRSKDTFEQGTSAVGIGNTQDLQSNIAKGKDLGWDVEIVLANTADGHSIANSYLNNSVALSQSTRNAERCLMALDLMMEDKDYGALLTYGIEGKTYVIDAEGEVALPAGLTADTNPYKWDGNGFWFINKDLLAPRSNWTDNYRTLVQDLRDRILLTDPTSGFAVNANNIKTEVANVQNVYKQYFNPIAVGSANDVEAAFATLKSKMEEAGLQKIKEEAEIQLSSWKQEKTATRSLIRYNRSRR